MKSILVLGATGNLGAYITLHFHKLGWRVIAASRRKDDGGFFADYNIPYYSVDITDKDSFAQLPTDIDVVADFAGDLPASMEGYVAERYINSIIKGTFNVLEWMRENKIPRIIFPQTLFDIHYLFGSREPISADAEKRVPLVGDHQMYVIAKMAAVEMIEMYHREYGLQRFIVRLSKVYQYHPNHYTFTDGKKTLINDWFFISKAEKGEPIEIWGDPISFNFLLFSFIISLFILSFKIFSFLNILICLIKSSLSFFKVSISFFILVKRTICIIKFFLIFSLS